MDFVFNPLTGQLDLVGSGGAGSELPAGAFDYGSITVAADINADYGGLT
jgi:hypothetical protein